MSNLWDAALGWIATVSENTYLGFAGVVIGVLGLLYAAYSRRKAKKERQYKELDCTLASNNIITERQNLFPKLEIRFDGQLLDDFTVTDVTLHNKGTDVIRRADIAPMDPISIKGAPNTHAPAVLFTVKCRRI